MKSVIPAGNVSTTQYCKMPDGTLICWGLYKGEHAVNTAWGALYAATINVTIPFPVAFISKPKVFVTPENNDVPIVRIIPPTTTGIPGFRVFRATSVDSVDINMDWLAIGRWK